MRTLILSFSFSAISSVMLAAHAASVTAEAGATIVSPLQMTKVQDINFGVIAPNISEPGDVRIDAQANRRICDSHITCLSGEFTYGLIRLAGDPDRQVHITIPQTVTLISDEDNTMLISGFSGETTGLVLTDGIAEFRYGGVLNVSADQAPGAYIGQFTINADYQ